MTRLIVDFGNDDATTRESFRIASELRRSPASKTQVQPVIRSAITLGELFDESDFPFVSPITPSLSGHAGKLVSRDRDKPAAQKHLAYLESQATDASLPAYRDWSQIEESHVHANRAAADHDAIKLFDLKRLKVISNADVATIERLAEVEHKRWCAERLLDGWIPAGNGVRDDAKQVHDNLVPWPSLSENTKQKDRDQVAAGLNVNFGKSAM